MAVILAIDAGTTGVRTMAVTEEGRVACTHYREFPQYFPEPGRVEHDAEEIWSAVAATLSATAAEVTGSGQRIAAIGITNQRETVVVWDRTSGRPRHRALVWQDRRTAGTCEELVAAGHLPVVRRRTGLVLDPYFSATKLAWLFGPGGVPTHNTAAGTVDSWILWCLTAGAVHRTDVTNASRTLLFDIGALRWDGELADLFGVDPAVLPEVGPSSGELGRTAAGVAAELPAGIPICGIAGDQQAALFGQACHRPGMTKNTYGTGSFVLMNVGQAVPPPPEGLLSTVAWSLGSAEAARTTYALEGSIFVTGAAVQWLRDGLGIISDAAETGPLAESAGTTAGAVFVPALTGLGSPWWDPHARGAIVGITRGFGRAELARAAVEAMAYQTADVVGRMSEASGLPVAELRVDGGATAMDLLLQMQADVLGVPVRRAAVAETTALGAAFLAGLGAGVWSSLEEIEAIWEADRSIEPGEGRDQAAAGLETWERAVERARRWAG